VTTGAKDSDPEKPVTNQDPQLPVSALEKLLLPERETETRHVSGAEPSSAISASSGQGNEPRTRGRDCRYPEGRRSRNGRAGRKNS